MAKGQDYKVSKCKGILLLVLLKSNFCTIVSFQMKPFMELPISKGVLFQKMPSSCMYTISRDNCQLYTLLICFLLLSKATPFHFDFFHIWTS